MGCNGAEKLTLIKVHPQSIVPLLVGVKQTIQCIGNKLLPTDVRPMNFNLMAVESQLYLLPKRNMIRLQGHNSARAGGVLFRVCVVFVVIERQQTIKTINKEDYRGGRYRYHVYPS